MTASPPGHTPLAHSPISEAEEDDDSPEPEEPLTPATDRSTVFRHVHGHDDTAAKIASSQDSLQQTPDPFARAAKPRSPAPTKMTPDSHTTGGVGRGDGASSPALAAFGDVPDVAGLDASSNPHNSFISATAEDASDTYSVRASGELPALGLPEASGSGAARKEQPSMFDVPAGFRKRSPDRSRQVRRTNTTAQSPSADPSMQGLQRAATEVWRPPTPPNHLLQKTPETAKKNPLSRSGTGFFGMLRRTTSTTRTLEPPAQLTSNPRDDRPVFDASKPISATNRRPSASASRPARSTANTPDASNVHTPPSPGSVSSESQEDQSLARITTTGGQTHSRSGSAIARAATFQTSIAWDPAGPVGTGTRQPSPEMVRRRSQSTEHIPRAARRPSKHPDPDAQRPQELLPTFSQHATEGSGLKSRRLSKSLPTEFSIASCQLNDEYKSTKVFASRGKRLGKGATSEVTIMAVKGTKDELVAVKEFRGKNKDEDNAEYLRKVKSEYAIAKSLHHPNIVETLRLCTHAGRWNHVMEYCELGDMYHLVEKGLFKTHYKLQDRLCFFKQILRAVDYLHSHGIAHRDIKLENLLLASSGTVKLTDFGVSEVFCGEHPGLPSAGGECGRNMGEVKHCAPGICGSLPYIAPEVLRRQGDYDPRPLDIWSSAITYITMQFGGPPWHSAKTDQPNYARFLEGWERWLPEHPDGVIRNEEGGWPRCGNLFATIDPPPLRRILLKMLHPDAARRISVREVLAGGFFKGVECCSPESYDAKVCDGFDASKGMKGMAKASVLPRHDHLPPREHKTPAFFKHRFDMGDGTNDGVKLRVI